MLTNPFCVVSCIDQSALDGFRVTNSGSVMIPSGMTKPFMEQRANSTASTLSTSFSTVNSNPNSYQAPPHQAYKDPYYQQQQQQQQQQYQLQLQQQQYLMYQQQQQAHMQRQYQQGYYSNSLPRSLPRYQGGYSRSPRAMPSSLPASLPQAYSYAMPQPPAYPGMSPLGMSPMEMGYSPMAHHHHHHSYPQGYPNQQYGYPTTHGW